MIAYVYELVHLHFFLNDSICYTKKLGVTRILQFSQHNSKLPLPRWKQGNYPLITIYDSTFYASFLVIIHILCHCSASLLPLSIYCISITVIILCDCTAPLHICKSRDVSTAQLFFYQKYCVLCFLCYNMLTSLFLFYTTHSTLILLIYYALLTLILSSISQIYPSSPLWYDFSTPLWLIFLHLPPLRFNTICSLPSDIISRVFFLCLWSDLILSTIITHIFLDLLCASWSDRIEYDQISLAELAQLASDYFCIFILETL